MIKDMTDGRPLKTVLKFALPMIVGAIFQQLYNVIDMFIVGNAVGSRALAAVGATGSATFFALALVMGTTTGFSAVTAQYFGAKDFDNVRKSFTSAIYITLASIVILTFAGIYGAEPLMRLLQTPEDIRPDAVLYLRICVGASAGQIIYNGVTAILRAVGDSRTPLIFLIISSILNVVLDIFFVWVLHMGVAGVAIATVLSQSLSAAACVVYMFKRFEIFHLKKEDFRFHTDSMLLISQIGLPAAFQSILLAIGDMTITRVVNTFGTDVVAAYATGSRIMQFSMMFCMTIAQAFSVFAGQNLGARKIDRIRRGFREICLVVAGLSLVMTAGVFVFCDPLVRFFISSSDTHLEAIAAIARVNLRITASFYIFLGLIWLYNHTLRSMGEVMIPFVSGMTELVLKVGLSILLSRWFGYVGIWFAQPIGWVLGLAPSLVRYHSGGWIKRSERFTTEAA